MISLHFTAGPGTNLDEARDKELNSIMNELSVNQQ
jgi:hypothetical protein